MKLVLTKRAERNLDEIYDHTLPYSEQAAVNKYNIILDEIDRLKSMPLIAAVEPMLDDLPRGYRSLRILRRYKAIYYVDAETIYVVSIWDCRRNPSRLRRLFRG